MKKTLIPALLLGATFSAQTLAACAQDSIVGFWNNATLSVEISAECKSSDLGPDYMQYSVWSSAEGSADNVSRINRGLSAHFDTKLVHILRSVDSDEIAVRSYDNVSQSWSYEFLTRQEIDNGGLTPP